MLKDWKRYVTGLSLMPVVIGIVYYLPEQIFVYFIMATALLAFYEYLTMFNQKKHPAFLVIAILLLLIVESVSRMGAILKLSTITIQNAFEFEAFFPVLKQFSLVLFLSVIVIPVFFLIGKEPLEHKFKRLIICFFGFFYIGLTFGLFPLVRHFGKNYHWLALALIIPWICDTAAYFGGRLLGKHKFSPQISPNKTWEGAVSGVLFSVIAGVVFYYTVGLEESLLFVIAVSFLIGIFGQLGDLVESLLKRGAGVKDSGKLFPGHGGILDRTDSLIVSVTVIFISFLIKNYVL